MRLRRLAWPLCWLLLLLVATLLLYGVYRRFGKAELSLG